MKQSTFQASLIELPDIIDFIKQCSASYHLKSEQLMAIELAVEEVVVNIISYAYNDQQTQGNILIQCGINQQKTILVITICDTGKAYNPLLKEPPNLSTDIEQRSIGGLGIYLTQQMMDNVYYYHKNGQNMLTMEKYLQHYDPAKK
jgi:anti-sigma regulatory factor (Ser/Thr protein kinase)